MIPICVAFVLQIRHTEGNIDGPPCSSLQMSTTNHPKSFTQHIFTWPPVKKKIIKYQEDICSRSRGPASRKLTDISEDEEDADALRGESSQEEAGIMATRCLILFSLLSGQLQLDHHWWYI